MASIYAPTKNEPKFIDNLFSILSNFSKHDVVLAGDWNLVLNDQLDKDGDPVHTNSASKECLKSYINEFNLIDVYRELNPSRKTYTRTQSQPYTATRLDFFLTGINLRHHIKTANVDASVKSDHKIVTITLNLDSEEWGRGYWKLNSDILLDNDYTESIKEVINDFLLTNPEGHVSPHILWESLKCVVRGETIKYCALEKKETYSTKVIARSKIGLN